MVDGAIGGQEPTAKALTPGAGIASWAAVRDRLRTPEQYRTYWLSTVRPDGRPHAMPVLGLWHDEAFYFISGETARKASNLTLNPACVLTVGITSLPALDLAIEGEAAKVTDETTLRRVVAAYGSELRWPLELREGVVFGPSAPTAGPPPYAVFELVPTTVYGLPGVTGTDEQGQSTTEPVAPTRWRFCER